MPFLSRNVTHVALPVFRNTRFSWNYARKTPGPFGAKTMTSAVEEARPAGEWPTLLMFVATVALWLAGISAIYAWSPLLGIVATGIAIAQHSSLQHEFLHGHPFRSVVLNEILATPSLCLTVPYGRFRDTHLAHHHDPVLTDPYDDPESNYLDPQVWQRLGALHQVLLRSNNTLSGRVVLGPLIGNYVWLKSEARLVLAGDKAVLRDWALHVLSLLPVGALIWYAPMGFGAYLLAVWIGHGLLKIRTYLEHRAHTLCRARTAIVEDRGPLALLFLHNNLHAVHHAHPKAPWYHLPRLYAENRDHYRRRTEYYVYRSYAEVFARHFLRGKEPVAHPFFRSPDAPLPKEQQTTGQQHNKP